MASPGSRCVTTPRTYSRCLETPAGLKFSNEAASVNGALKWISQRRQFLHVQILQSAHEQLRGNQLTPVIDITRRQPIDAHTGINEPREIRGAGRGDLDFQLSRIPSFTKPST